MDGVSLKGNKESPKTPGGISKSLLTPCRRVGLSRKWKKSGCSPFISPLSTDNATPEKTEVSATKKRKCDDQFDMNSEYVKRQSNDVNEYGESSLISCTNPTKNDITSTPSRNNQKARKKSKLLSLSLKNSPETKIDKFPPKNQILNSDQTDLESKTNNVHIFEDTTGIKNKCKEENNTSYVSGTIQIPESVSKLVKSKSKSEKLPFTKSYSKDDQKLNQIIKTSDPKKKGINNLTKECIVVIQNKIFKNHSDIIGNEQEKILEEDSVLDVPLSVLKKESNENENIILNTLNDNDFISKPIKKKIRNLSTIKRDKVNLSFTESNDSSQSSQENSDKHTIIIKKTYEKVIKPQKAKSTGSITQKDIDDMKARIDMKKKLLVAKSMSIDTEELRDLIKKWQRGCQEALMELLALMKRKLPDRQNMDYAEILHTLKIPSELVGYDSENDCFITPDDTNVLFSAFKL